MTTDSGTLRAVASLGIKNVLASQWAASSAHLAEPLASSACSYDVSFVGMAYGNRRAQIDALAREEIKVDCFGHGWPLGPVSFPDVLRIYRSSRITLNFADSGLQIAGGLPGRSRQIKARTFEVPGAGGFLITEENPDLARYFDIGGELVTYADGRDLAQKIRHYLHHPDERDAIARAGHQRVRRGTSTKYVLNPSFRTQLPASAIGAISRGSLIPISS